MKLRAKIYSKYLKQILSGKKKFDYRQLETITFVDSKTGREYEFEIKDFSNWGPSVTRDLKKRYPDVKWDVMRPVLCIEIGRKINKMESGKIKCGFSDEGCTERAEYKCENCGAGYCSMCAASADYECGCIDRPELIKITRVKK